MTATAQTMFAAVFVTTGGGREVVSYHATREAAREAAPDVWCHVRTVAGTVHADGTAEAAPGEPVQGRAPYRG